MRWSSCGAAGDEPPPSPRSGHSATLVGDHLVVVFGGLHGTTFRADTVVFDAAREAWFRPRGAAVGGPARARSTARWRSARTCTSCAGEPAAPSTATWVLDTETWSWADLAHQAPPARLLLLRLLRLLLLLPPRRGFPGFSRAEGFRHRRRRPRDVRDPPLRRVRRPEMAQRRVDAGRRRRPMARPRRPARPAPEVGTRHDRRRDAPRRFRGTSRRRRALRRPVGAQGRRRSRRRDNEQHRRPRRSRSARGKRRSR